MQKSNISKRIQFFSHFLLPWSVFLVLPICTLFLGSKANMLIDNFTYLANHAETQAFFFLWAFICTATHFTLIHTLLVLVHIKSKLHYVCFFVLILATILPYEHGASFVGLLHVVTGYIAFILFNIVCYQIYEPARFIVPQASRRLLSLYCVILSCCFSITMYYGSINGLVEVIYCISTPIILLILKRKVASATFT